MKKNRIYISGQITGLNIDDAFKLFEEAEEEIKSIFHDVEIVNPMKVVPYNKQYSWEDYMREDLKFLLGCDKIYMMKNYVNSKGAQAELQVAKWCGIDIILG